MIQKLKKIFSEDHNFKELLKGSSITFVLKIIGMSMSYIVSLIISRKYGAEGVGLFGLSNRIILSLGIFCAFGFNVSVLRYVGEYNVKKNKGFFLRKILNYFFQISFPISVLVGFTLFFLAKTISVEIFQNTDYIKAIKIIAFTLPFFTLNLINVEFIRGLKLLKVSEYFRSVNTYLTVLILLSISIFSYGLLNPIYALACGIVLTFLASLFFIYFHLKNLTFKNEEESISRGEFFKTSIPMMITTVSSFILAFSSVFFLEVFSTTKAVGIYSVCIMLSQLVSLPLTVVNTISAPKFSELYWNRKEKALKKLIQQSAKLIFWSALPISVVLVFGSTLILSFFGKEFILGQKVLIVLILGQLINAITGSVGIFLNMTGHQKVLRNIILSTVIIVVFSCYLIIPTYGMIGAAIVSFFGVIILNMILAIYVYKKLGYITFYFPFINRRND